jgi:hypothetical protein
MEPRRSAVRGDAEFAATNDSTRTPNRSNPRFTPANAALDADEGSNLNLNAD